MTSSEMMAVLRDMVGQDVSDALADAYLSLAKEAIVNRMFPYSENACWDDVPGRLHVNACEIACYLINKRGAEGETTHSESGVSRTYASAGIPAAMLAGIVPHVGVPQ